MGSKLDLVLNRGQTLNEEFQYIDKDGNPISLVGKTIKFVAKESETSTIDTFNKILVLTDIVRSMFSLIINKTESNIATNYLIYDIFLLETGERLVYGQMSVIGDYN